MDAISQAAQNVAILMKMKLDVPPVKLQTKMMQGSDSYVGNSQTQMSIDSTPTSIIEVFEVWEVMLDENEYDLEKAYVVVSGKYKKQGYSGGEWGEVKYEGFYTTPEEAKNEIDGYLS